MKPTKLFACVWLLACLCATACGDPQTVSCSEAKLLADGTAVRLEGKAATSCRTDFSRISHSFNTSTRVGTVASTSVNEASGLAVSRKNAGVMWVHNDSGDSARVFAMNTAGAHLGIYTLSGASATDYEDIAIGPGPVAGKDYLYVADTGDNSAVRSSIRVYRVQEPTVSPTQSPVSVTLTGVQALTFVYEDGARDAETLMIDPRTGDLYVVTKRESLGRVYRASASTLVPGTTITLHRVATLTWTGATGGDISPQGDEIIIRGYTQAFVWARPANTILWDAFSSTAYSVPLASEPQGEAIAYDPQGNGYYTTSEGTNQPIYYYARQTASPATYWHIEEPTRASGIRAAAPVVGFDAIVRGSRMDLTGQMATTSDGERYIANTVVSSLAGSPIAALGITPSGGVGGDFGAPPMGQRGADGGFGLNCVGMLARCCGRVSSALPAENYVSLSDGSGTEFRVEVSGLRNELPVGRFAAVTGLIGLRKVGSSYVRVLRPRTDEDVTLL